MFDLSRVTEQNFNDYALELFHWQYEHVAVYREYVNIQNIKLNQVHSPESIPYLPIQFFKTQKVIAASNNAEVTFTSSGTSGTLSKHFIADLSVYEQAFSRAFNLFYGKPEDYCIIALLPSYLERKGSSLIYMMQNLIERSQHPLSGFFLNQYNKIQEILQQNEKANQKTLLIGVSFALVDMAEQWNGGSLHHTIVMETGGMKGRRKELLREEMHQILKSKFGIQHVHSEYGMTELLSQAYSSHDGLFSTPPWLRILVRDVYDPMEIHTRNKQGALNVIDLANQYSCAFLATDDLGYVNDDGTFTVNGRVDSSEIRGCNLMIY